MATNNNSKPAAELRIGTVKATVWEKRGRRHHPSQRHLFADLPRGRPVEDHTESFRFVNLLSVAKLADQAHTLIAERKAEAAQAAGDNEAS